jgi:hypothetical protein
LSRSFLSASKTFLVSLLSLRFVIYLFPAFSFKVSLTFAEVAYFIVITRLVARRILRIGLCRCRFVIFIIIMTGEVAIIIIIILGTIVIIIIICRVTSLEFVPCFCQYHRGMCDGWTYRSHWVSIKSLCVPSVSGLIQFFSILSLLLRMLQKGPHNTRVLIGVGILKVNLYKTIGLLTCLYTLRVFPRVRALSYLHQLSLILNLLLG